MQRHSSHYLIITLVCYLFTSSFLYADWEPLNEPFTARIDCLHAQGSVVLAGTSTGIYRSSDAGAHWLPVVPQVTVKEFCVVGTAIYAGTDNSEIIVSYDTGQTWEYLSTISGQTNSLIFHRGTMYAGGSYNQVHKSLDSGRTWTPLNNGLPQHTTSKLVVANDRILIGAINTWGKKDGGIFILDGQEWKPTSIRDITSATLAVIGSRLFAVVNGTLYISDDSGETWQTNLVGLGTTQSVAKIDNSLFLSSNTLGLVRSEDNGLTWSPTSNPQTSITALAATESTLVAGSMEEGIFVTSNKGMTWKPQNNGLQSTALVETLFNANDTLYAADRNRLLRSTDRGTTWKVIPIIPANSPGATVTAITAITTYNNHIIIVSNAAMYRSSDNGITWYIVYGEGQKINFRTLITLDKTMLAGGYNINTSGDNKSGLLFSNTAGESWRPVELSSNVYTFVQHGNRVFASTSEGVFSSDDKGEHWTAKTTGLPSSMGASALASTGTALFVSIFDQSIIYVSKNNGESWQPVTSLPEMTGINLFMAFEHYLFAGSADKIYMSADNGQSWQQIESIPNTIGMQSLISDGKYLYAGTYDRAIWRRPMSDIVTSINEPVIRPTFSLYPQPMSGIATLTLCDDCAVRDAILTLTTLDGRLVFTQPQVHGRSVTIHRNHLPAGTYIFTLAQDARAVASGIIVME